MWRATILTLFPEMFPGPLGLSLAGKALVSGLWSLDAHDIRAQATDRHGTVDDTPAGGGPGMVMKADVLARAIDAAATDNRPRAHQQAGAAVVCRGIDGAGENIGFHHHAGPAAGRCVVHGAVPVGRMSADVVGVEHPEA